MVAKRRSAVVGASTVGLYYLVGTALLQLVLIAGSVPSNLDWKVVLAVPIFVSPFLVRRVFSSQWSWSRNRDLFFFFFFLASGLVAYSFQLRLYAGITDVVGRSSRQYTLSLLGYCVAWILVGVAISRAVISRSSATGLVLAVVAFVIVLRLAAGDLVIDYEELARKSGADTVSHIGIADSLILIFFFAYSISGALARGIVFLMMAAALFLVGSRTALYMGLLSVLVIGMSFRSFARIWGGIFVSVFAAVFLYALTAGDDAIIRHLFFAEGITEDLSYIERVNQISLGLGLLGKQFWVGDPDLIVETFGTLGAYMHNGLSAWQFYGFGFFLVLLISIWWALRAFIGYVAAERPSAFGEFCGLLLIYSVLCIFFTRAINFNLIWLSIGLWIALGCAPKLPAIARA